jgi:hypothetical protein
MGDNEKIASRNQRIKFFAAGAIVGAILGLLVDNIIIGSAVGMAIGVLWWTKVSETRG